MKKYCLTGRNINLAYVLIFLLLAGSCAKKKTSVSSPALNPGDSMRIYHYYNAALEDKNVVTAEATLRKGIDLCRELGRPKEEGFGYTYLGGIFESAGEYSKAIKANDTAIHIFRRIGYLRGAYFKAQIGQLAAPIREGRYVESMNATLKLLSEAKAAHDTFYIARLLSIQGINAYNTEDYPAAIRYGEEGLDWMKKMNGYLLPHLCDLAMIYNAAGKHDKAAAACYKALSLMQNSDWYYEPYLYSFLGDALLAQGKTDSAFHTLQLASKAATENGDGVNKLNILTSVNTIYEKTHRWQSLLQSADSGLQLAHATGSNGFLPALWISRATALERLGRYRQALQAQRYGDSLATVIAGDKVQQNIAVLEARHKTADQQLVIRELNVRMEAERIRRIAISALLIMAVIVAVTGVWLWLRQRRLVRKVQEQAKGLAVLIRELHHRVKNNLQLVSSMLYMQQLQSDTPQLREALDAAIGRIDSITLIHQHLYRDDVADGMISMQDYLHQLSMAISTLHENTGSHKAVIMLNAEKVRIDISTAVPVGLILAELITNSFRHAQQAGQALKIMIRLNCLDEDRFRLSYQDNGPGIPPGKDLSLSMGMRLTGLMARQAGGELVPQQTDTGVYFEGIFKTEEGRQKIA